MSQDPERPAWRPALLAGAYLALGVCAVVIFSRIDLPWNMREFAQSAVEDPRFLVPILIAYVVLLALPFVPAAEIGFVLLALFGAAIALPVYLATLAALLLAFTVGRLAPRSVARSLHRRLTGAAPGDAAVGEVRAIEDALWRQTQTRVSNPWLKRLLQYRTVALIVLINTPGNTVLGGGGGIALAAGVSGLFSLRAFLFSIAIACAPVPAAVLLAAQFDIPFAASLPGGDR